MESLDRDVEQSNPSQLSHVGDQMGGIEPLVRGIRLKLFIQRAGKVDESYT